MQKILLGSAITLLLTTIFFYKQNHSCQQKLSLIELNNKIIKEQYESIVAEQIAKQKALTIQLNQQLAKTQQKAKQINLKDKSCITTEFLQIINEN